VHILPDRSVRGVRAVLVFVLAAVIVSTLEGSPQSDAAADSFAATGGGEGQVDDPEGILDLDIEQLARTDVVVPSMDIEVTSVTRTESTVGRSPAAVFVITPEMIRRSGATCIPEVLRMVPGLEVARINSNQWAVSSRGFNSRYANKLLVQIDGRSIYNSFFSGVYWEANDVMLEDIERIEVIRGPGATVWGANAVNGVINIITKSSQDTQGLLVNGVAGTEERGITAARYGGRLGRTATYRVYGKWFDRDRGYLPGAPTHDDWRLGQGGFRMDWRPTPCDTVTVQGDYYDGQVGLEFPEQIPAFPFERDVVEDGHLFGGNVLARWSRDQGKDRGWAVQFYYDDFHRHVSVLDAGVETIDVDFQHQFPLGWRHKLVWGGGYRYYSDHSHGSFSVSFDPHQRDANFFDYFLQDEITLVDDRLFLMVGSKFVHNSYTGFEYQPGGRVLWSLDPRRVAWAAISRAVRVPARSDDDMRLKTFNIPMGPPPPVFVQLTGDRGVDSEELMAYEVGYRAQPTDQFSWDLAFFFNKYEDLIVYNPGPIPPRPGPPDFWIWPWVATNGMDGTTYGGELTATWQVTPGWRMTGSYSYLRMHLHADAAVDSRVEDPEGYSPSNQVYWRSSWDLNYDIQFDLTLRYVDALRTAGVPSYTTMDFRLGWRPSTDFEIAVVGQNLLDDHHWEFLGDDSFATEVDRGVYGTVTWRH